MAIKLFGGFFFFFLVQRFEFFQAGEEARALTARLLC